VKKMQYATFGLMSQAHIWLMYLDIKRGAKNPQATRPEGTQSRVLTSPVRRAEAQTQALILWDCQRHLVCGNAI